jgi:hypothetical protein
MKLLETTACSVSPAASRFATVHGFSSRGTQHAPMLSRKERTSVAEDTSMALAQENSNVPFARSA